jgi:hypothetical protein
MIEMSTSPAPAPAGSAAPTIKPVKSYGVSLTDGAGSQLRIVALARKDGSAQSFVTHVERDKDGKVKASNRGATTQHASMDEAKAHVDKLAKKATSAGWQARKMSGVGRAKPDTFGVNELPAPKSAARK